MTFVLSDDVLMINIGKAVIEYPTLFFGLPEHVALIEASAKISISDAKSSIGDNSDAISSRKSKFSEETKDSRSNFSNKKQRGRTDQISVTDSPPALSNPVASEGEDDDESGMLDADDEIVADDDEFMKAFEEFAQTDISKLKEIIASDFGLNI